MPLTGSEATLATAIKGKLDTAFPPTDPTSHQALADAIAQAVIQHIIANSVITVSGVTVGPGSATGTIS